MRILDARAPGALSRRGRADRRGRRPRAGRAQPPVRAQPRRRRSLPAARTTCASRCPRRLDGVPPERADRDVRLGRHRLPPAARARARRARRARDSTPAPGASGRATRRGPSRTGAYALSGRGRTRRYFRGPLLLSFAPLFCPPGPEPTTPWKDRAQAATRAAPGRSRTRSTCTASTPGATATSASTPRATSSCARTRPADHEIDLHEVIRGLEARDLTTPVVVRFSDILRHRLKRLHDAFASAIAENDYRNRYARRVPDQGEPAAPGGRGGLRLRARVRLRPRGGLQARAARGHGDDRGRVGAADRLQRLQGRQLHRGGDPRDQARPHDHPGGRELRRARA